MNIPMIQMPRAKAKHLYDAYRRAANKNPDDRRIMRGYRELSEGRDLIDIVDVIRSGGVDEKGQPRLAVCQASAALCYYGQYGAEHYFSPAARHDARHRATVIHLPSGTLPRFPGWQINAKLPPIPPHLRPATITAEHFVLWEAEWTKTVPRDPALLRRISTTVFAVLAVWDLTELERAVLSTSFR